MRLWRLGRSRRLYRGDVHGHGLLYGCEYFSSPSFPLSPFAGIYLVVVECDTFSHFRLFCLLFFPFPPAFLFSFEWCIIIPCPVLGYSTCCVRRCLFSPFFCAGNRIDRTGIRIDIDNSGSTSHRIALESYGRRSLDWIWILVSLAEPNFTLRPINSNW